MSQGHNLSGQLRMFIPAGELKSTASPHPGDYLEVYDTEGDEWWPERKGELWDRKLVESRMSAATGGPRKPFKKGLYKSIEEGGVKEPIRLAHGVAGEDSPVVAQGHHRIAAAADIDPNMLIPVEHYEASNSQSLQGVTFKPGEKNQWVEAFGNDDAAWENWQETVNRKLGRN